MLEESSPNPPTAPAPAPASAPPSAVRPLSPEDLTFWRAEIDRARTLRNDVIARWDSVGNLERYTPESVKTNNLLDARVNVAKDFSDVERKKAALFYDTPEIALVPDPGTDGSLCCRRFRIVWWRCSRCRPKLATTRSRCRSSSRWWTR